MARQIILGILPLTLIWVKELFQWWWYLKLFASRVSTRIKQSFVWTAVRESGHIESVHWCHERGMNWTMFIPPLKLRLFPVHPICVELCVIGIVVVRLWWKIGDQSNTNPKQTSMNVIGDVVLERLHCETQKSSSTFKSQPVFIVRPRAECVHDYITQNHGNKER